MLDSPFPGEKAKPTQAQIEAEGESFMALMGQVGKR